MPAAILSADQHKNTTLSLQDANGAHIPAHPNSQERRTGSLSTVTYYGLKDLSSVPTSGGVLFFTASRSTLRTTQPPIQLIRVAFSRG